MKTWKIEFETLCNEHLAYLERLVKREYRDHPEPDALMQDALIALAETLRRGERIKHPRGFLAAVLKNRYHAWLRARYRSGAAEFTDEASPASDPLAEREEAEREDGEREAVRREVSRLVRIYREVTVRHYFRGQSVDAIARELGIPRGTVLSRLSAAREQIKEGVKDVEKYSSASYEPKRGTVGIFGSAGLGGEPFSLLRSDIETNILDLAYEAPRSVRCIADTMGMPSAYLEPIIEGLIRGELMGQTAGGLVYTRCYVQKFEDSFGDIPAQEALARAHAAPAFRVAWRHFGPLTEREAFRAFSEKQKATMLLFLINQALNEVVLRSRPDAELTPAQPPARPNGGRWLATLTVYRHGQKQEGTYVGSGPVHVGYSKNGDGVYDCQMFDCQSVFGDAHWAYGRFKYTTNLVSILRFYASFLPCDVTADNKLLYELIPEFEALGILRRESDGTVRLDVPAMPFDETVGYWDPACRALGRELTDLFSGELRALWERTRRRVPRHVDEAEHFRHAGALGAYARAVLLRIVEEGLMPYPVAVGKTPLIFISYREAKGI